MSEDGMRTMREEKEELLRAVKELSGHEPPGLRILLPLLIHPDVIEFTLRYVNQNYQGGKCTKFEAPWNCAREADARRETLKYGWLAATGGHPGIGEWWCTPCRMRAMGET